RPPDRETPTLGLVLLLEKVRETSIEIAAELFDTVHEKSHRVSMQHALEFGERVVPHEHAGALASRMYEVLETLNLQHRASPANDTAVQRRAHEGAKRPSRPSAATAG